MAENGIITDDTEEDLTLIDKVIQMVGKYYIATLVLVPVMYLVVEGQPVPEFIVPVAGMVVAYYFPKN